MTFTQAIVAAQREEMRLDERVFVMGQDIQSGLYGDQGFREFGPERVRNVPISEAAFHGAAVGAALTGLRPIVDTTNSAFMLSAMDQIVSQAAKSRYMFGGQADLPVVFRCGVYYGNGSAAHHSERPWSTYMTVPGLRIVAPTTPADAKGLLTAAIRLDDPVIFFEDLTLAGSRGEVPDGDLVIPIGSASIRRAGRDVTIVAIAGAVPHALRAADALAEDGIDCEVIDPRTLKPLDMPCVLDSLSKTGRLVVADPAPRTCGAAAEIAARVCEDGFDLLRAPIVRVTAPDIPIPFSRALERLVYPDVEKVTAAVRRAMRVDRVAAR
jgi:pyruvate dehydrogenase E1 component beta subunit